MGVVLWGSSIWMMAFATWETMKERDWWAVPFAAILLLLVAACLWFYGVLPWRRRDGRLTADRREPIDP